MEEASNQERSHVIAARIEGPSYSVFPDGINGLPPGLQKAANIHVVVVADTDMLMDKVNNSAPDGNALFVLNTLDNLSAPDTLAAIRPRVAQERSSNRLEDMRKVAKQAYRVKAGELERRLQRTEQEWQRSARGQPPSAPRQWIPPRGCRRSTRSVCACPWSCMPWSSKLMPRYAIWSGL